MDHLDRNRLLYGNDAVERLQNASVAVFGIGGVGGHCAESLVRSGVGRLIAIDRDVVDVTNINRQVVAFRSTVGEDKVTVFKRLANDISPECETVTVKHSFSDDFEAFFTENHVDFVADCIDDVTAKLNLISYCKANDIPIISSMGTALRVHPEKLIITDIYKTEYDPLARVIRHELRKRNIKSLDVVSSVEEPKPKTTDILGSSPFVPAAAGLIMASFIVNSLIQ